MSDPEVHVWTAEAMKKHPEFPGKQEIISDYLRELETREDIPKETRERIRAILAA